MRKEQNGLISVALCIFAFALCSGCMPSDDKILKSLRNNNNCQGEGILSFPLRGDTFYSPQGGIGIATIQRSGEGTYAVRTLVDQPLTLLAEVDPDSKGDKHSFALVGKNKLLGWIVCDY